MTKAGKVETYSRSRGTGTVHLNDGGRCSFGLTSYYGERGYPTPVVGEPVRVVYTDDSHILAVLR